MNIRKYLFKHFINNFFRRKSHGEEFKPRVINNSFGKYEVVEPFLVSQRRYVPSHIPKPAYYLTGIPQPGPIKPEIKDKNQIECMKESCELALHILSQAKHYIEPGVTTDQLDEVIHDMIINNGAYPSPLNYKGFPKSICTSVNNVACHGIPDNRPLKHGDIINVDVTVYLNGYHGDCSKTFEVGESDPEGKRLIQVTELCLQSGILICKPNEKFSSIAFVGHGIGTYFHGPPDILHYAHESAERMHPGMTFTVEPILTQGGQEIEILEDGWTAVTTDDARTAQSEHTILITDTGYEIMTK
ncbi:PREDICTED: methionine aminopeptidase 1D, mitochondrial isoform X2 [Polistes canadensis]|uniref:methionine aminopeptidase 1D, mitochondrial isoform X2 n=1 Tax=Polistes canadensis TaxID=91411 RepID=UPI000718ED1C|nr:PREDICTED: methionine aminopeptidase 1D, mitochondrial isoform X2 [Polistes canadensis]